MPVLSLTSHFSIFFTCFSFSWTSWTLKLALHSSCIPARFHVLLALLLYSFREILLLNNDLTCMHEHWISISDHRYPAVKKRMENSFSFLVVSHLSSRFLALFSLPLLTYGPTVSPVCRSSQKTTYGVARNEVVHVSCDVEADPSNVSFKWYINNSDISSELKSFTSNGTTRSTASYATTNPRSYGKLICWGENSIGRQKEPCVFSIILASPPDGVHNCSVRNQSLNNFLFSCQPGDNGGLRQIFFLEVYTHQETSASASVASTTSSISNIIFNSVSPPIDPQTSTKLYANLSSVDIPEFFVQNLPPGTKFTFNIYAANSKGRSPSLSFTTSTLSPPEKQTKIYGKHSLWI